MPRKHTRKNKRIRGGEGESMFSGWMPDTSALNSYIPDTSSITGYFTGKKEEPATTQTNSVPTIATSPPAVNTSGGKKKGRRRRMRGGSYSPNSSSYGANAGPYSGPSTARAQAWVGGKRKSKKKRRKH